MKKNKQPHQKRHTDGQKAQEKMLSTTNYQRKGNQNYKKVFSHTGQNGSHQKNLSTAGRERV